MRRTIRVAILVFVVALLAVPVTALAMDDAQGQDDALEATSVSSETDGGGSASALNGKAFQTIKVPQEKYSVAQLASAFKIKAEASTPLSFSSSNEKVAKVDASGKVTVGKRTGSATITITAAETDQYAAAEKKVKVRVSAYKKPNGMVVHSAGGTPSHVHMFHMGWNFVLRCTDPDVANHAATAARYITKNSHFSYAGRFPTSQASVNKRASIYFAIVKVTGKNPTYKQLKKIMSVNTYASTSCTPAILCTYWLYYNMSTKIPLKWYGRFSKKAYMYYCGAPNVEAHQLEKAIRQVNKEYRAKGKLAPFKIIYVPASKRSSFFGHPGKNLKRGDIIAACPNPNANGHTAMVM